MTITTEVATLRLMTALERAYVVQVLDRSEVRPRRRTSTRAGTRSVSSNREAVGHHTPKARPREHDAPHVPHATRWLRRVARPAHQGGTRGAIRSLAALAVAAALPITGAPALAADASALPSRVMARERA